jgi:hypothetical protein
MEKNENEVSEWAFSLGIASILTLIWFIMYKPFKESHIIVRFFGVLSILFFEICLFFLTLFQFDAKPPSMWMMTFPGGIYCIIALLSKLSQCIGGKE